VALIATTTVLMAPAASAQDAPQMRVTGILADHVWVDVGAGAGACAGERHGAPGFLAAAAGEFVAAILGVRSDLWVLQTGADPQTSREARIPIMLPCSMPRSPKYQVVSGLQETPS
jgi:hypothetical protein